jgi:hypothetical protein
MLDKEMWGIKGKKKTRARWEEVLLLGRCVLLVGCPAVLYHRTGGYLLELTHTGNCQVLEGPTLMTIH